MLNKMLKEKGSKNLYFDDLKTTTENKNNVNNEEIFSAWSDLPGELLFENRIKREWLTTKEAAHFLSISENALRIIVHRGKIPVYKFGHRLRFRLRDCQALFKRKGV